MLQFYFDVDERCSTSEDGLVSCETFVARQVRRFKNVSTLLFSHVSFLFFYVFLSLCRKAWQEGNTGTAGDVKNEIDSSLHSRICACVKLVRGATSDISLALPWPRRLGHSVNIARVFVFCFCACTRCQSYRRHCVRDTEAAPALRTAASA